MTKRNLTEERYSVIQQQMMALMNDIRADHQQHAYTKQKLDDKVSKLKETEAEVHALFKSLDKEQKRAEKAEAARDCWFSAAKRAMAMVSSSLIPIGVTALPKLNIILFPAKTDDNVHWWIAQCIEHDIATQAILDQDAVQDIIDMINTRISLAMTFRINPFDVPPPPAVIVSKFDASETPFQKTLTMPFKSTQFKSQQWEMCFTFGFKLP